MASKKSQKSQRKREQSRRKPKLPTKELLLAIADSPGMGNFTDVLSAETSRGLGKHGADDVGFHVLVPIAVRATYARRYRLYEVPDLLKALLDERGKNTTDFLSEEFFQAYVEIGKKDCPEPLFKRDVCFVTTERRNEFYRTMRSKVWSSLKSMHTAVLAWHADWCSKASNAAALVARLGDKESVPGLLDEPPMLVLRDAATVVEAAFVEALSGYGSAVARVDLWEAARIKDLLTNKGILEATGEATTEALVRKLGINVPPEVQNVERDLFEFAMGTILLDMNGDGSTAEKVVNLKRLGERIPWDKLDG